MDEGERQDGNNRMMKGNEKEREKERGRRTEDPEGAKYKRSGKPDE